MVTPWRASTSWHVGDVVNIGSQDLSLMAARETGTSPAVSRGAETHRLDRFAVIGSLADKALALGRGSEAERILETLLKDVLQDVRDGHGTQSAAQAATYGVRLAQATGKGSWVNYVVELYQRLGEPSARGRRGRPVHGDATRPGCGRRAPQRLPGRVDVDEQMAWVPRSDSYSPAWKGWSA